MRTLRSIQYLLLALVILAVPAASRAQVSASITIAPPELVVYTQPVCPQEGYLWTPGYWAYGDEGYFWVPGTWIEPPSEGLLWTPGYWVGTMVRTPGMAGIGAVKSAFTAA